MTKLTSETELCEYFLHLGTISPEKDVRILDLDGITHIFSAGDDNSLYLSKETDGAKSTFVRYKLFENIKTFDAQLLPSGSFSIALVSGSEVLVGVSAAPETLNAGDFRKLDFSGMLGGKALDPYRCIIAAFDKSISLFVEFRDDSGYAEQFISRLNGENFNNVTYFPIAANFSEIYMNVPGRAVSQQIDGFYTYGVYGDITQLLYTPSVNVFGTTLPIPLRLKSEGTLDAICSLKLQNQAGTHLFAAGNGKLYFYPFREQYDWQQCGDNPERQGFGTPREIASAAEYLDAKQISSYIHGGKVYLFIRNGSGDVYYTFADYADDMPVNAFFQPVKLCDEAAVFSAHEGKLSICTKDRFLESVQNEITGAFVFAELYFDTQLDEHQNFSVYSTKINVQKPGENVIINFNEQKKTGFWANNFYHKTSRYDTESDALGYVTIIQKAENLAPNGFSVSCGGETLQVEPGEKFQKQLLSMTEPETFKQAQITDFSGNVSPLVTKTEKSELQAAAAGVASIRNSIQSITPGFISPATQFIDGVVFRITDKVISILPASWQNNPFSKFVSEVVNDVAGALNWLIGKVKNIYDKTIGKVIDFIVQKTEKVWKFFIKIGEKVVETVLDCMDKVLETLTKVLEMIGIPMHKIFDFFKKVLGIDGAVRINNAIKNMARLSVDQLCDNAAKLEEGAIEAFDKIIDKLEGWTGIAGSAPGDVLKNHSFSLSPAGNGLNFNSHNMYMMDLIRGSLSNVELPGLTLTDEIKSCGNLLSERIMEMGEQILDLGEKTAEICGCISDLLSDLDVGKFITRLKQVVTYIAGSALKLGKSLIVLIIEFVRSAIKILWKAISTPIHIPFLSKVLEVFGVDEFSIIDLVTFPAAFLANIAVRTAAMFGSDSYDFIDKLAAARSFEDIADGNTRTPEFLLA